MNVDTVMQNQNTDTELDEDDSNEDLHIGKGPEYKHDPQNTMKRAKRASLDTSEAKARRDARRAANRQ